jgi:hypothetical protein
MSRKRRSSKKTGTPVLHSLNPVPYDDISSSEVQDDAARNKNIVLAALARIHVELWHA